MGVTGVALLSIVGLRFRNTLFVVPNGIEVQLTDGVRHRFVLWGRAEWLTAINGARSRRAPA